MIYKNFKDKKLSALGMGCMRLPLVPGSDGVIDEVATAQMTDYAIKNGINYFDTAWGYHGGNSETVMGKILEAYPREDFYLASKFPGYDSANFGKAEEIFNRQLEKCRVEYFDFYLLHSLTDGNIEGYLNDEKYGDFSYLLSQKKKGRIKHLGFSTHADIPTLNRFLERYGDYMEFCQVQLNYIDYDYQNAKEVLEILKKRNIPVWVMEPVRGGKLACIGSFLENKLSQLRKEESVPGWAFRFIQSIPEVCVTLSGMSDFSQLQQNIEIFSEEKPLDKKEWDALIGVGKSIIEKTSLPCTECRYCVTHCPKGLDIPSIIGEYNEMCFSGEVGRADFTASAGNPGDCIGCRACEQVCPQKIEISRMMSDMSLKGE